MVTTGALTSRSAGSSWNSRRFASSSSVDSISTLRSNSSAKMSMVSSGRDWVIVTISPSPIMVLMISLEPSSSASAIFFTVSPLSRLLGALSGGFGSRLLLSRLLLSRLLSCLLGFRFLLGERLHLFALPVNLAGRLDALPDRNIRSSNRWHTLGSLLTRVRFLRAGSRFLIWLPCRLLLLLFAHRGGGECIFHLGFLDTGEVALHVKPSLLQFLSQLLGASASVLGYLVYPSLSHVTSPANLLSWFPIRFFEAV